MSSQQLILDVTSALISKKKKERLAALEKLTSLLSQEKIIKTLHKGSNSKDNSLNWDIIFIKVHNAVLSVIDENDLKSRQVIDKHQAIIQNVILEVAQKSLKQKVVLINCNLFVSCILAVFETSFRIKVLGSTYLYIFSKYVMPEKKNWTELKEEYWIGIKSLCTSQYANPAKGIQSITFLEILIDVIRNSSKSCQISHRFVDLFAFIKDILISFKNLGYNFEIVLLRLTNTLCLQLAVEFRYKVCEFMENVFDNIINFHEKKKPENNILIYHFLMTAFNIHNPNGLWEDKSVYACNLRKWKCQIREIYFLCRKEVRLMLKNPSGEIGIDFLDLFVYSYHLVSAGSLENFPEICDYEVSFDEPGPSNKRKCSSDTQNSNSSRSSIGRTKQIKLDGGLKNLIKDLQSPDSWFWLEFLELLLQKFPCDLKEEYTQLVEVLYQLLCDKRDARNTKAIIRCLCCAVEMESSSEVELQNYQVQELNETWNKISLELLRSLQTETYPETHLLTRSLISHRKLRDPGPLIRLYCSGNLQFNIDNFRTLCVICQNCILPDILVSDGRSRMSQQNYENVRVHLLLWLMQGEEKYPCKDLAKTLIALVSKRFEEEIGNHAAKEDTLISRININDFCKLITNNYMVVSFKNLKLLEETKPLENNPEARLDSGMINKLVNLLTIRGKFLMDALEVERNTFVDQSKIVNDCFWFCELLCNLLSLFDWTCESEKGKFFHSELTRKLEILLHLSTTKCINLMRLKMYDLTPLFRLYEENFHQNVQKKLRSKTFVNLELLKIVFEVFEDRHDETDGFVGQDNELEVESMSRFSQMIKNPQSILHFGNLNRKQKIVVNCAEFLCQYVAGYSDAIQYQSALAKKILDSLVFDKMLKINSDFHLQLVLRVVYNFTKYDGVTISNLNSSLSLIKIILNSKPTDPEVIITVLQILKDLTVSVNKIGDEDTKSSYMEIIAGFRRFMVVKNTCGVKTVSKFIECLAEISKVDSEGKWGDLEKKDSSLSAQEEIISFLKHSYHEVRLTAAQHVGLLFSCTTEAEVSRQREMLTTLFDVLSNNAELCPKERGSVSEYFNHVISSVSLISWAKIICLSSYWRKKALFYLLYLAFLKNFKKSKVEDIIKLICKELKFRDVSSYITPNFSYLFYKWVEKELEIQEFPYYLLGCQTVDDFVENHFPTLVAAYSQLGKIEMLSTISTKLNKPVSEVLTHCHSMLIAYILPNLNENADCKAAKKAQRLKRFINQELSVKTSIRLLTLRLDEVVFHIIRNMHDPAYLKTLYSDFAGNDENDRGPSNGLSASQIVETLENLSTNEKQYLLGNIALEAPAMIQKIFLYLLDDLEQAVVYEDKVFVFYKYIFFVEAVSRETSKGSAYLKINPFILRDVVYTVAAVIRKDERGILSAMACVCFRKMAEAYVIEFSSVLGKFLPAITTVLMPLAKKSNKEALQVLNFLICENYDKLEPDILCLDPFPPDEIFSQINQKMEKSQINARSLKSTIEHFVRGGRSENSGCRIEGLKNLRDMLSKGKEELRKMYEELKMLRGFSEDCKKSLLHQLICMLVELTSDKDTAVKKEAANCLGELGASDLTTLVLRPENNFTACKKTTTAIHRLVESAVNHLSDLIISDNYNVKKASSKALYAVLSTRQGRDILMKDAPVFNIEYLKPFSSSSNDKLELKIKKEVFLNNLYDPEQWRPNDHEEWIVNLMNSLLQALSDPLGVVNAFRELIQVNWQFAENIFPAVLDFVISLNEKDCSAVINRNVNEFFRRNFDYKDKSSTCMNKTSVRCMVNVVDYIRMQEEMHTGFVLNINYLHVAKAALYCSAFFTSIFYAELWFEERRKEDDAFMDINTICELYPKEGFALTEILRECHSKIGNFDGIHGCGYMHILNPSSEIQHYEHLKNWSLSMVHHDIQLSQGALTSKTGLFNSLERSGMFFTLNSLIKASSDLPDIDSVQYKCAAKLQDWSQIDSMYKTQNNLTADHFDKCYYFALKAFNDEDDAAFQNETHKAMKSVLTELTHCSLESTKNLYLPISELQCLKELEEFALIVRGSDKKKLEDLFRKWDGQDYIKCSEFKLIETILSNRTTMIRVRLNRTEDPEMKNYLQLMLCDVYHKLTVAARKEKKFETAIRTLSHLSNMQQIPEEIAGKAKLEKARMLWERGDREIGRFLLSHFIKTREITGELRAKSLRIYGDWMAKTKSENSREIIENYYLKSIMESNDSENRLDSFFSLAKFADSNYEQLNEYLSSPLFEIKQSLINTQQDLASELRQEPGWNQNREMRMAYQLAAKQSAIDENEIKNSKAERDSYLNLALRYYLLSLKEGEKCNLLVFRVISLWLSNASNHEVIQQLQKILHHIPTYKFLCLLPQLVPRMADVCLISNLVEQILQDHPHHTLPLIFALKNSYEDLQYNGIKTTVTTPRVLTAKSMLEKFQKNPKLERFIVEMCQFSNALIELANYNPPEKGKLGSYVRFPDHLRIRHIQDFTSVSVPSLHIPYSKNGNYEDVVGVRRFVEAYQLVGGVNLPKRIKCIGTDGLSRTLLVKGKDDLRQDAVMQQVFTIMNSLLYENSETNKRKLVIRTYKVVPLSHRSGVIEWCKNTQPLSLYLTGPDGRSGAHKKFYPNDATAMDCRVMIREVFTRPLVTTEDKLKGFLGVCKQIHPVFHHFFIEQFPAAGVWFERRLAYIHSVATSSMIGYILGIGDRHVQNILIDNATAEVIHIDLGIAFEQGKTLPIPETVPFRLTRDIVDGMGSSGIEGDFRISCVKTMEVLRENQDTILTLLEVLLYDPLYTWTITPEKAYSLQNHTETSSTTTDKSSPDLEINKMAERALIRLKQKLQGTEGGCVATNVEGQVNYLLQQARDPNNLCRLFHGWQAYL